MPRLFWLASLVLAAASACAPLSSEGSPPAPAKISRLGSTSETFLWGTGFFIDRQGDILTARHLTTGCGRIDILGGGKRQHATLIATSATDDLSLLRVGETFGAPLRFATRAAPRGGAFVAILGYAALHDRSRQVALNSMVLDMAAPRHLALVSDAAPGFSGSPVVTSDGQVIGVLQSKLTQATRRQASVTPREIRLAVSGGAAREFLSAQGVVLATDETARAGLLDLLAAAEVRVECHFAPQSAEFASQLP